MSIRRQLSDRRQALIDMIQNVYKGASLETETLPTFRELAEQYDLSLTMVHKVVKQLEREGLVRTKRGEGTSVRRRSQALGNYYLYLTHLTTESATSSSGVAAGEDGIENGFTARISELGGATLSLGLRAVVEALATGSLPTLSGIFVGSQDRLLQAACPPLRDVPRVAVAGHEQAATLTDTVSFDDVGGGRMAAQHLMDLGHRRIGFLACHAAPEPSPAMRWSGLREAGWRAALSASGIMSDDLAYFLEVEPQAEINVGGLQILFLARASSQALVNRREITAVVAANDWAAQGLLQALRESGRPLDDWPSVVGFDDLPDTRGRILTSLRLPPERLGKMGAEILWQRAHGQLTGPAVHRYASVSLRSRISSHPGWTRWLKMDKGAGSGPASATPEKEGALSA